MAAAALRGRMGAQAPWLAALASCLLFAGALQVAPHGPDPAALQAALPVPREELNETMRRRWELRNAADIDRMKELCRSRPLDVLLLGDSITERWHRPSFSAYVDSPLEYTTSEREELGGDLRAAFGPQRLVAVAAIGGDKVPDLLWRLRAGGLGEAVRQCAPRSLHVLVGTNDLGHGVAPREAGMSYRQLVDELVALRPDARLTLQLVMPRGFKGGYFDNDHLPHALKWAACPAAGRPPQLVHGVGEGDSDPSCSLFFSHVGELNGIITRAASEHSASGRDVRTLDCNGFLTTGGSISKDLHPNGRGYARWSECLRSAYP